MTTDSKKPRPANQQVKPRRPRITSNEKLIDRSIVRS